MSDSANLHERQADTQKNKKIMSSICFRFFIFTFAFLFFTFSFHTLSFLL